MIYLPLAQSDEPCCMPLQKPLHRYRQLTQKALDDWPTLCKFVLHHDLQNIRHECDEGVLLHEGRQRYNCLIS